MEECGDGFYERLLDNKCAPCHESCETCENSSSICTSCKNVTGLIYYLLEEDYTCYLNCPIGFYGSPGDNKCLPCHDYCSACYDGSSNTCTACAINDSIPYFLQYGTEECVEDCPDGEYKNVTSLKCQICSSNCLTCDELANKCTSCFMDSGAYVFLSGTLCVQQCPVGEYEDNSNSSNHTC